MAGELTVIAEFETTPATYDKFLKVCAYDSERSVADESGCHSFTVLSPETEADTVILVEVYTDRAAFEEHLRTPHFEVFANAVKELDIKERSVRFLKKRTP
ncbi:antibiotic biosynthesis monooxygenase [Gluconobacter kondonii]|uniref:putative quinol monooxygenase n=1 Tax=Gluconobacter kondonii TaxID=941463 RepID=UPI0020A0F62C|nr:putative quinol monooxygenase [Gluconobacter kondonii]MCP1236549.1 antibiotic biosynthesis monooxygenase [Gluconobacter kondonii]